MTKAIVVFALVVLFVSLQRVTGSLEWVQANKKNYRSLSRPEPAIRHTSRHEILDELSRVRRDGPADGSGQPSATRYVFKKDSHRNGIIQYCGGDSKVCSPLCIMATYINVPLLSVPVWSLALLISLTLNYHFKCSCILLWLARVSG